MYTAFMITLREGIEAFLIVAITLAYLRKTGRPALAAAVLWGAGVAIVLSVAASFAFAQAENKPLWEGVLALAATVMVATFTVHMLRAAKHIKREIEASLAAHAGREGRWAALGVFAFTVLMITREGMETALLLVSAAFQNDMREFVAGGVLGVVAAGVLAMLWGRYGHRINLARFLQVTAVFLLLFVVQLAIYSFHELTEAGVLPLIDNEFWHVATEPYGPEGEYGHWLSYGLVLVPLVWLVWASVKGDRRPALQAGRA